MNLAEVIEPFTWRINPERAEREQIAPPDHVISYEIVRRGRTAPMRVETRGSKTRRGPYL